MKKLLLMAMAAVLLQSCDLEFDPNSELNRMKSPVVLIGKHTDDCGKSWSVMLKDANGKILSINSIYATGSVIGSSNKIGDTIR